MAEGALRRQDRASAEGHPDLLTAWRFLWLEGALADLSEIVEYIAERNPAAVLKVAAALHHAAARLGTHPRAGRRGRVAGTRELVVPRLPFVIAYRMKPDRIEVMRVIHGRRNWRAAFRERT